MDITRPRRIDGQARIVVPPEVREALGVQNGDFVAFVIAGGEVRLRRVQLTLT